MSDPRPAWHQGLLPALILSALMALLWGWFVPQANESAPIQPGFGTWDFHNYFLPRYAFGTQELLAGRLPLWNRFEFAGMPFLATLQPAALYPPKILAFALFDSETAMQSFLIGHYALLIGAFLLFLRSLGITGIGALAGGAFIAFNSSVLMGDHHPFRVASLAWTPVMFWLADHAARTRRRAPLAFLAITVAMQLLVGYPEFTLHASMLLGIQAIAMWAIGAWPAPPWRTLPRLAAAFVFGAMLAGLQLAPFAELLLESQRAEAAQAWIEQWRGITLNEISLRQIARVGPWVFGGLSLFWLAALPWRRSLPAIAGQIFILWMAASGWLLLRELPVFSGIRHPLMWLLSGQLPAAWLVALGADTFVRRAGSGLRDHFSTWSVAAFATLWFGLCVLALQLEPAAPPAAGSLREIAAGVAGGPSSKWLGAIGALLIFAAAVLRRSTPSRDRLVIAGIVSIVLGQIAAYPIHASAGFFRRFEPAARFGTLRAETARPIEGRIFSIEDLRWGYTFHDRIESVFGFEASLTPSRFRALQQQLGFEPSLSKLNWSAFGAAEGFLDALDVEFVVAPWLVASALPKTSWQRELQRPAYDALLRNRERPGRAWVVYGASTAASPQAALDRLLSPSFDPRAEVILEAPLASVGAAPASDPPTSARVDVVSPTEVEVAAELPRPGILVLSEAWFPGWVASVDGAPAEILRANYVLRGVALGTGSHRVRFEYRPASLRIGATLTLLGVCAVLGLFWSDRRGREMKA